MHRQPPQVDKLVLLLDSLPDDEVITASEVQAKLGITRRETVYDWARHNVKLSFYSYLVQRGNGKSFYVFGNPRAIIAIRKLEKKRGQRENSQPSRRKVS
jgi:hypothetical protein